MKREPDRQVCAASAVMWALYWTVVVKWKLSRKAKLLIYWLTCGPELWAGTKRKKRQIQVVDINSLHWVLGPRDIGVRI